MKLLNVFPSDDSRLVLWFSDGHHYKFSSDPALRNPLRYSPDGIEWKNGERLSAEQLHAQCKPLPSEEMSSCSFVLGVRDNAPIENSTAQDVSFIHVRPFNAEQPFQFGAASGSGASQTVGAMNMSIEEMFAWPHDWKEHFRKSGCEWAIALVEEHSENVPLLMQRLADYIFERKYNQTSSL